jgi:hypothetical protein
VFRTPPEALEGYGSCQGTLPEAFPPLPSSNFQPISGLIYCLMLTIET